MTYVLIFTLILNNGQFRYWFNRFYVVSLESIPYMQEFSARGSIG